MHIMMSKVCQKKYMISALKIIMSVMILGIIVQAIFINGTKPYSSFKDYSYQNDFSENQADSLKDHEQISQNFVAKGNILDNLSVYFAEISGENINLTISDKSGKEIYQAEIAASEYNENAWNRVGIQGSLFERGKTYTITLECETGLGCILLNKGDAPVIFEECFDQNNSFSGTVALGLQFTYRYMTLGSIFELLFKVVVSILIGISLCYAILNIEKLVMAFKNTEKKRGLLYALYFSVTLVLLYNPLESIRTEVTEFSRVIGAGIIANVDVSKRISNFNHWFVLFAVSFALLYLLANYRIQENKSEQANKVVDFLDNYMVLANCCLALNCITFFNDETGDVAVYHFSSCVVLLVAIATISYIALHLDKKIKAVDYAKIMMVGASLSYPIAICISSEWDDGRVLLGVLFFLSLIIIGVCAFGGNLFANRYFGSVSDAAVAVFPLMPIMTSFYIELIHVLNQYEIFVAHPAKYYKIACALSVGVFILAAAVFIIKTIQLKDWKRWAFPWFVTGIALLSVQIPISTVYNPSIFEGANYGILINDFLKYGRIPIIEHYGGHMMTAVWEGILYALVNNDTAGAIVSPYSVLLTPFLALLFYYLMKYVWDERIALFVTLLFPFMGAWEYFGLGVLVCIAAMAFVKKNTYTRAFLLWASFIWCALYRLDLGFAYGIGVIISMIIYVIATGNRKATKMLGLTLGAWVTAGGGTWFLVCAVKGIHPINRLMEFLMISYSNQNWANINIGNPDNTVFGWTYMIVPFLIVICLLYTIFSRSLREHIGHEKWLLLLILGLSYFGNYSRGLVRHSLAEGRTTVAIWTGYIFLAVFLGCKKTKKHILPIFLMLILCNTLFHQSTNYVSETIADGAVARPAAIIESWEPDRFDVENYKENAKADGKGNYMTYWEKLSHDHERVQRVKFDGSLERYIAKFELLNVLLEDGETFIDFMDRPMLYPMLGRESPLYVSQSPMQLSGEYTQTEFLKEMSNVPLVLMPGVAGFLVDGVSINYKYYKVAEYIYRNYEPLYQYESAYAVWCLKDRYDEYKEKVMLALNEEEEYVDDLADAKDIILKNARLSRKGASVRISSVGPNPQIRELQRVLDCSPYTHRDMKIVVDYETDKAGQIELFYTTDKDEKYTKEKSVTADIADKGSASFVIPITKYTRIKLNIPEKSNVIIHSLTVKEAVGLAEHGYDGPTTVTDNDGNKAYNYLGELHHDSIAQLPRIWAEEDKKNANDNPTVCELVKSEDIYTFDQNSIDFGSQGNYLKLSAIYDGKDTDGLYGDDDEQINAVLVLGLYTDGQFEEKCRYGVSIMEGKHDYLIRCSADYYWYLKEINAVRIECDDTLHDIEMKILEGD